MFYILDKPINMTSRTLVDEVKKSLSVKKAGHSGTLDPFASGLLIIGTDNDTKLLDKLLNEKKTYTGLILFGKTTDSLDIDGKVIEEKDVKVSLADLKKVVNEKFIGKIKQVPPAVSAKRVNGKRAYDLQRENIEFELKPVKKIVYSFDIFETDKPNEFKFTVEVSSGTYIRALARDLGKEFDAPAMLLELRRIKVGNISIESAIGYDNLIENRNIKSISASELLNIKEVEVPDKFLKLLLEGKRTNFEHFEFNDDEYIFKNKSGDKVLANQEGKNTYKILKRIN